jgi:hypothetical protein
MAARALSSSSSSFGEEEHAYPRPSAEKPSSRDTGGSGVASSDEIGENGVLVKRAPAAPKMKRDAESPPPKKNMRKAADAAEEDATSAADSDAETTAPADEATSLDGATPPPSPQEEEAGTHLKEKSDRYPHVWQMVLALEKEYSFPLKKAFLKLTEARAAKLNAKVKNLCLKEVRTQLRRTEMDRAVVTALMELIQ